MGAQLNTSIPFVRNAEGVLAPSPCQMYVNYSKGNETQECQSGWEYLGADGRTIITEVYLISYLIESNTFHSTHCDQFK